MKFLKYLMIGLVIVFFGSLIIGLVTGVIALVLQIAIPVLIIAAIGYVVVKLMNRNKSLPENKRPLS